MSVLLSIDGYDVTDYLRVAHDQGLDPAPADYIDPQFSGSPAFSEGESWSGDAVGNREMVFPLFLKATTVDALYQIVRDINARLTKGVAVRFRSSTATSATTFQLERGRLDPQFEYWIDQASRVRATLTLWVRPYGHTGTQRLIASQGIGSRAVFTLPATGVLGDVAAAGNLEVRVGSAVASSGRVVAYGFHPNASSNPILGPSSTTAVAQSGATVVGASGAVGSQYLAVPVSPTGASGVAFTGYLDPVAAHVGRHRVLAIARSGLNAGIPLYAKDRYGQSLGATAVASQTDVAKWGLVDLGEINVAGRASGQEPVPTQYVEIYGGGASGNTINASPALHLNRVVFLPLDYSAGILRTRGAAAGALYGGDTFARLNNQTLDSSPNADQGGVWVNVYGSFGGPYGVPNQEIVAGALDALGANYRATTAASGLYAMPNWSLLNDAEARVDVRLAGGSRAAGSVGAAPVVDLYPKRTASAGAVRVRWGIGPSPYLALETATDSVNFTARASAGMPSMLASGYLAGQRHSLYYRSLGGAATVWLATSVGGGNPVINASHAEIAQIGYPGLGVQAGYQGMATAYIALDNFTINTPAAGASDIDAREWFRFESFPENRTFQGNASVYKLDQTANHRGALPKVPAVGSPGASGPGRFVVMAGEADNFLGNDGPDVALTVVERFKYLA